MQEKFDLLIDSYLQDNIGITEDFLNKPLADGLFQNILQLQEDNKMQASGIGNSEQKDDKQKMRSDKIYWMDKSHDNIFEQEYMHMAEDFISRLNNTCYTGINDYEFHYAVYEEGSFYKRHKDQFKNDSDRKVYEAFCTLYGSIPCKKTGRAWYRQTIYVCAYYFYHSEKRVRGETR